MFNSRKLISFIVNAVVIGLIAGLLGTLLKAFSIPENIVFIIALPFIIYVIFYKWEKINQNRNSIGWVVAKKIVKDEEAKISIFKILLIVIILNLISLLIELIKKYIF